jgi:2'-5' RNA ligase
MRLFIAINLLSKTKTRLIRLRDELQACSSYGKFSTPENLHLTLVFLGECDEKQVTAAKSVINAVEVEPFSLPIERVGRFRRDKGDIWWAGVREDKSLLDFQQRLTDRLIAAGFDLEKREYSPHITLAREVVTDWTPHRIEIFDETVTRIDLMKSERLKGNLTYTVIHSRNWSDR